MKNTQNLLRIMAQLRDPEAGCPWDLRQDFRSLAPYAIEEAYEVAEALENGQMVEFQEELGDLLLQVVFQSQMAKEQNLFDFEAVAESISNKLIRRHPHVCSDKKFDSDDQRQRFWEEMKQIEKKEKGQQSLFSSVLGEIPLGLPALLRAQKLQSRAARYGFDWPDIEQVLGKLDEELDELKAALRARDQDNIKEELGDLIFVIANIARHLNVDAEESLRDCNRKFTRRFNHIEEKVMQSGNSWESFELSDLDVWWDEAKQNEKRI
jgi:MazG family protein